MCLNAVGSVSGPNHRSIKPQQSPEESAPSASGSIACKSEESPAARDDESAAEREITQHLWVGNGSDPKAGQTLC